MKRILSLLLLIALLPLHGAVSLAEENELPRLYKARCRVAANVYESVDKTEGVRQFTVLPAKSYVVVHHLDPTFAYVTSDRYGVTGYVKRVCLDNTETIDPATTPPYGVEFNHYITCVIAQDAPVLTDIENGEVLITLHKGAKLSLIGYENGYAKLIYHRQYGYIDSNLLSAPVPVYVDPETAGTDAPIAAYTSFYKTTEDETNIGRMKNIDTACEKLCAITLQSGNNLDFNRDIGPYRASNGYHPAPVLVDGKSQLGYGGGTCQVSSTLYNVVLQLPGLYVIQRRAHGNNGASYLPIGVDAAVGNSKLNFRFRNHYLFPIRIDASAQDGALTIAIYRAE
ncbi:MAG: VanW family protein [Clostridia bacterium]|nr:VanW family protein [Clostridia bacterium]